MEHVQEVHVELRWVETLGVRLLVLSVLLVLFPGGDPVLSLNILQRVVVWANVVRTVKSLPDDSATLRQRHKAVPEGQHADDGGVDVLNREQVP